MTHEQQRRAYLQAMQVTTWLPRIALPFAAPSNADVLASPEPPSLPQHLPVAASTPHTVSEPVAAKPLAADPIAAKPTAAKPVAKAPVAELKKQVQTPVSTPAPAAEPAPAARKARQPVPRFALQLLRADNCVLLVETPTGFALQARDPAYLLLKDMLRAAGLTDRPRLVGDGEPIHWPLFKNSRVDQGPQAALDYVQEVLAAEVAREPCACIWLVGLPALRYGAGLEEDAYNQSQQLDGLGLVWALPGLELLMDEPSRKASLWQAMRTLIPRWKIV